MSFNENILKNIAEETKNDEKMQTFIMSALQYESGHPVIVEKQYESFLKEALGEKYHEVR